MEVAFFALLLGLVRFIAPLSAANSLVLSAVKGTACPGGELVYNCTASSTSMQFTMRWREAMTISPGVLYLYDEPGTHTVNSFDDFMTTASIIPPDYTLTSTATLSGALLSHNNFVLECFLGTITNPESPDTIVTKVLGAASPPSNLTIISPAVLTWLPPAPNEPTDCVFNYTINITTTSSSSSSCSMTVYSSNTSLILTDLLTSEQNYSFAVAVTDSTGQHGPWSDQLIVTYDVPGIVSFIVQLQITSITVAWQPPLLTNDLPVLHYVVSYNTSDNSTVIQTQLSSSISSYTVSSEPGVTYYITVRAVNVVGPGVINNYSIVDVPLLLTTLPSSIVTSFSTNTLVKTTAVSMTSVTIANNQVTASTLKTAMYTNTPSSSIIISNDNILTTAIVPAAVGGIIFLILISSFAILFIICFIRMKGKRKKRISCGSNTYSQSFEMNAMTNDDKKLDTDKTTCFYADLAPPLRDNSAIPPPRPPPPVDKSVARGRGELIYADLGSVTPCNKPAIPPPPADRVIYSDAREFKPKESNKEKQIIYADLGTAPGKRPMAPALSTHDQVVYSSVHASST